MHLPLSSLLLIHLFSFASIVAAQNAPDEVQVSPNAQCNQSVRDQITSCLDQGEQDESKLSTGPCSSSDWNCICTKQQGMVDCYSECPGLQPVDMVNFNGNNCKGQHSQTIKAEGGDLTYTWSTLPFTSASTEPPSIGSSTDAGAVAANGTTDDSSSTTTTSGTQSSPVSSSIANATTVSTSTNPSTTSSNTSTEATKISKDGTASSLLTTSKVVVAFTVTAASLLVLIII